MSEFACPICKRPSRPGDPAFPFCSKRCKMVDLGRWVEGRYRVSRPLREDEVDPLGLEGEPLESPESDDRPPGSPP